jgi:hypothetical protein
MVVAVMVERARLQSPKQRSLQMTEAKYAAMIAALRLAADALTPPRNEEEATALAAVNAALANA